ncbi:cation transporter [Litorilituus sediminis]|uniref:Cation transporter n=1 Tax=Litorilituus sediminis TaxID=718192 RepID=A0A4P6PA62_9GAMM|nr:cation transporter [Litorilituus sediminis]QBG36475.1 cation transporter [Litorilituus sediminis]
MKHSNVEQTALWFAAIINLVMAFCGWLAFYYSNAQAILLDGNYSFIAFIVTLIAIRISAIKAKRTKTFPYGQYVYESLFSLSKGIMIIGVLSMALTSNISRIFHYINGEQLSALNTDIILIYAVAMVVLCAGLGLFCQYQNKKINYTSSILRAEFAGAKIDGAMSLALGLALYAISFVAIEGSFGFLHYIGDAILVSILVLLLSKEPFVLVRDSFVELAGGTLQNQQDREHIEAVLNQHFKQEQLIKDSFISKTGSSYLIAVYISGKTLEAMGQQKLNDIQTQVKAALNKRYPNTILEIILT